MQRLLFLPWLALIGCDAIYTDLRPDSPTDSGVTAADAAPVDAFVPDGGPGSDAGARDLGPITADAGADAGAPSGVTLVGTFEGRGGYDASGTATLRTRDDHLELVFSDDFASAAVPGPVVVVTSRSAIGTELTSADTIVARLDSSSIRGANTFEVDLADPPSPVYVFVYCEPFGVETARAEMVSR